MFPAMEPAYLNLFLIHLCASFLLTKLFLLSAEVFTSANTDQLLDTAAAEYVGHPRGVTVGNDSLQLSSLFQWYAIDFGADQEQVLETLGNHSATDIKDALQQFNGATEYFYDWSLNGYCIVDDECGS